MYNIYYSMVRTVLFERSRERTQYRIHNFIGFCSGKIFYNNNTPVTIRTTVREKRDKRPFRKVPTLQKSIIIHTRFTVKQPYLSAVCAYIKSWL